MSSASLKQQLFLECTDRCRSKRHAEEIFSAIAKTTNLDEQIAFLKTCFNYLNAKDAVGRTVLHVAASLGRTPLVRFLLEEYERLSKSQSQKSRQRAGFSEWVNIRDNENGWTALHRALFYGHVDCVRLLLQNEAIRVYATDKEGLNAFDLANTNFYRFVNVEFGGKSGESKSNEHREVSHGASASEDGSDSEEARTRANAARRNRKKLQKVSSNDGRVDVLVWGINANHTLGCESDGRINPESVDTFRRAHISITQVCLTRFHSVFLSQDGAVYTCGHGRGGRLGHSTDESFILPKLVHIPETNGGTRGVEIAHICASENHTIMIARTGVAYVCGSNEFGQLANAQPTQPSAADVPSQKAKTAQRGDALQACNSVLDVQPVRIASGWKGESRLIGACTSRVHSVFWTAHAVFTCGLNQGQLGYAKTPQTTASSELRPVTLLDRPNLAVRFAVCSELATCVYTTDGDIFLLTRYTAKKLPVRLDNVVRLFVFSTNTTSSLINANRESGASGSKFLNAILALRSDGELYFWHEAASGLLQRARRATNQFLLRFRDCDVTEWSFNESSSATQGFTIELLACTSFGSAVHATLSASLNSACTLLIGARVANVQRATRVFCELLTQSSRAKNFGALQASAERVERDRFVNVAMSDLAEQLATQFRELQSGDDSYDLVLVLRRAASCTRFFAHRFVLASRCSYLAKLIADATQYDADGALQVQIDANVDPALFRMLLQFVYSGDTPLFVPGYRVELCTPWDVMKSSSAPQTGYLAAVSKMNTDCNAALDASDAKQRVLANTPKKRVDDDDLERIVAELDNASLKQENVKKRTKVKQKSKSKATEKGDCKAQYDALSELRELALRFGMSDFCQRLRTICLNERNEVQFRRNETNANDAEAAPVEPVRQIATPRVEFDRTRHIELCDVQLKSNDGQLFACHKCVLTARLDYFRHMFVAQFGWREAAHHDGHATAARNAIGLPFPAAVCEVVLNYVYTDQLSPALRATASLAGQPEKAAEQFDLLCGVLIAADHLLIDRLRQLVEYELCELLTLRNTAFMLQLASLYNAAQLRMACLEFIRLNVVTFLEQRLLDELSEELIAAVSEYYRSVQPQVAGRSLVSSSMDDYPTRIDLAQLVRDFPKQRDADLQALAVALSQSQSQSQSNAASLNTSFSKTSISDVETAPSAVSVTEQQATTPTRSRTSSDSQSTELDSQPDEPLEVLPDNVQKPAKRSVAPQPVRIDPPSFDSNLENPKYSWSGRKWTSSISYPTGECPLLPETITTDRSKMVSLREIMAQQTQSATTTNRPETQIDATPSQPTDNRAAKHKVSQKERKARVNIKASAEVKESVVESPPTWNSVNVWEARRARLSSGSQNTGMRQNLAESGQLQQRDFPNLQQAQRTSAHANEQAKVVSFKQLLNAELADAREVARLTVLTSARANLECIEIEEHAIQQLTELYNAENTFDVHITVARVAWDERGKVKPGWVAKKS